MQKYRHKFTEKTSRCTGYAREINVLFRRKMFRTRASISDSKRRRRQHVITYEKMTNFMDESA